MILNVFLHQGLYHKESLLVIEIIKVEHSPSKKIVLFASVEALHK